MKKQLRFPQKNRLLTKAEHEQVFAKSHKVSQKYLLVLFQQNKKLHGRISIIVGKRVARYAVTRNKIKRIIRESFRINQNKLKGFDIIVIARSQCDTLDKVKLREGIDKLWEKLLTQYQNFSS